MRVIICSILFLLGSVYLVGQNTDLKLAQEFYKKGEYEKALPIFEKLYKKTNSNNNYYYQNFFNCLINMKKYEEAKSLVEKQIKKSKNADPSLRLDLGKLYRNQENEEKANAEFEKAIQQLKENPTMVRRLANAFNSMEAYDYAIQSYQKGIELTGDSNAFAYELALTYKRKGDYEGMIDSYLNFVKGQPAKIQIVKNEFQRTIKTEEQKDALQTLLYRRIQKDSDEIIYPELLTWFFIQEKDFDSAFIQVKALDTRLNENGKRVYQLAQSASIEEEYDAALNAYQYIVDKGKMNPLYQRSYIALLNTRMNKIGYENKYTEEELMVMEQQFIELLDEMGKNSVTASSMRQLSHLYAFYLYDLDKAIAILKELIAMPSVNPIFRASSKLDLGDFYVMKNDVWEATLYYSQVDKAFKEDILGEEARFKNAKLSYYNGDFSWSQSQLNVLKASTSELIANDALELSVFIMDNSGLDTSYTAMEMFSRADLLLFQNRVGEAQSTLDSIEQLFPGHALADDILFRRGSMYYQQRDFPKAAEYFQMVIDKFADDILADNALFKLGEIYQFQFEKPEQAMKYYQDILLLHSGSLFTAEARKRFRKLRGDYIN